MPRLAPSWRCAIAHHEPRRRAALSSIVAAFTLAALVGWVLTAACTPPSQLTPCGDKWCPIGATCFGGVCASAAAVQACAALADGASCAFNGAKGVCAAGLCSIAACGNGVIEAPEVCDDGNRASGDGCARDCFSTEVCGNGIVDDAEGCDCGADEMQQNPRCAQPNSADARAECTIDCRARSCGDGTVNGLEDCDGSALNAATCTSLGLHGGTLGCSGTCRYDVSACERCGDGVINGEEFCDGSARGECVALGGYTLGTTSCSSVCTPLTAACESSDWTLISITAAGRLNYGWAFAGGLYWASHGRAIQQVNGVFSEIRGITLTLAVTGTSATNAFFVGHGARIFHYDGDTVTPMAVPASVSPQAKLRTAYAAAPNLVFAGGGSNDGATIVPLLLQFDGATWRDVTPQGWTARPYAITGTGPSNIWLATEAGDVYQYQNGSWMLRAQLHAKVHQLQFDGRGRLWATANNGQIWYRENGTFVATPQREGRGFLAIDGENVFFVLHTSSLWWDGKNWLELFGYVPFSARGVVSGHGQIYVGGFDGKVARLNSLFWHVTPSGASFRSIWVAPSGRVYSGDNVGNLYSDALGTPRAFATDREEFVVDLWGVDDNHVWAVRRTAVYFWNGTMWTKVYAAGSEERLYSIGGSDAGHVYVGRDDGTLLMWNGEAFAPMATPAQSHIYVIDARSSTEVYVAGRDALLRFDGTTWQSFAPADLPVGTSVRALWVRSATDIWMFAKDDVEAYRRHYDGVAWGPRERTVGVQRAVVPFTNGRAISIGRQGEMALFSEGGWSTIRVGSPHLTSEIYAARQVGPKAWLFGSGYWGTVLRQR